MTKNEREYLDRLEEEFKLKSAVARNALKRCTLPHKSESIEFYAAAMDICAELAQQIRSDFEKLEKEGEPNDEQKTS